MSEEGKRKVTKSYNIIPKYKHHKVGDFNCESEVEADGKIICCLHNPITGEWRWPEKGDKE
jgi:hypothetical protein